MLSTGNEEDIRLSRCFSATKNETCVREREREALSLLIHGSRSRNLLSAFADAISVASIRCFARRVQTCPLVKHGAEEGAGGVFLCRNRARGAEATVVFSEASR